jgi:hypothetical protein
MIVFTFLVGTLVLFHGPLLPCILELDPLELIPCLELYRAFAKKKSLALVRMDVVLKLHIYICNWLGQLLKEVSVHYLN